MGQRKVEQWLPSKISFIRDPALHWLVIHDDDLMGRCRTIREIILEMASRCRNSGVESNFNQAEAKAVELMELLLVGLDDHTYRFLAEGESEQLAFVAARGENAVNMYRDLRRLTRRSVWGDPKRILLTQVAKAWSWAAKGATQETASPVSDKLFSFLIEAATREFESSEPKMVSEVIREHDASCEVWQISQAFALIEEREARGPSGSCRPLVESLLVGFSKRLSDIGLAKQMIEYIEKLQKPTE